MARVKDENERLRTDKSAMANGIEKGAREVLEAKDKEIDKLRDRVNSLEAEVDKIQREKEALERELERAIKVIMDLGFLLLKPWLRSEKG